MDEEIKVSIICNTYNQKKYIRKCLESLVTQKTTFQYEVLVHDDASNDGTTDIIKEFEEKYPNIIKPIYQIINQYSQGIGITWNYQFPRIKGDYVAFCEGDDFWCDNNKLQEQFDVLEENEDCMLCVSRTQEVFENETITNYYYPNINNIGGKIDSNSFIRMQMDPLYRFHTTSFFIRKECIKKLMKEKPSFFYYAPVLDTPLILYCGLQGNVIYIEKIFSCYRKEAIGSWTVTKRKNNYESISHEIINMYKEFDNYTNYEYTDSIMFAIQLYEFYLLMYKEKYNQMIKKCYRVYLNRIGFKTRVLYYIWGYIPFSKKIYDLLRIIYHLVKRIK